MKYMKIFFDKEECSIFDKIKSQSAKDLRIWNLANLLFPIATIAISSMFYFFSVKSPFNSKTFGDGTKNFFDFLLNGSIPLIGINLLVACSFFLIKFDKNKEQRFGLTTGNLRLKLIVYSLAAYLLLSALFAIQTINSPFESIYKQIFLLVFSIIGIYISIHVANKLFILQEEFIDKSFDKEVSDAVDTLKKAIE